MNSAKSSSPKGAAGRFTVDGPNAVGIVSICKFKDEAWEFCKYLPGDKPGVLGGQEFEFKASRAIPTRKSNFESPVFTENLLPWEDAAVYQSSAEAVINTPRPGRWSEIDSAWREQWDAMRLGRPVQEAMDELVSIVQPMLEDGIDPPMPRKILVTTTSLLVSGGPTLQDNREKARALLERACASRPDIVCLPETVTSYGIPYTDVNDVAETVPGPFTEMASSVARRHGTYIICPVLRRRDGRIYNAAVLLDRQGQIVGTYDKLHPVVSEAHDQFEKGVTPGNTLKVFDTDFGRIGILICFDINWRQEWARLKEMGAEIVFWPSAYDGGLPLQARALDHHYYVVSAVKQEHARIIDMLSSVLVETGPYTDIAEAVIDLDKKVFSTDYNLHKLPALRLKYGRDVTIDMRCDEDMFSLESQRADLSVADLMAEFGMQTWSEYIARASATQDAGRLE